MTRDPWHKTTLTLAAAGRTLRLDVPHDVFSTLQIDDGTRLLLEHLPAGEPRAVLDLGCGYGALGLPVAARHPDARVVLVDRDLLAVEAARRNAATHALGGVTALGSLGYRDLPSDPATYDWLLCNVPARIGRPFIEHLLGDGRARLSPGGELRVVVITDLAPTLESLALEHGWPLRAHARGARHVVFGLAASSPDGAPAPPDAPPDVPPDLYLRDRVHVGDLELERPFDLGGDDPRRLAAGLPLILDALPATPPARVLCFRAGYGALPLSARGRWPSAHVTAVDRDLLATTFVERNARRLGLDGARLVVCATVAPVPAGAEGFDLVVGELSPSAGARVAAAELAALAAALRPGGQALVLVLEKLEREWLRPLGDGAGFVAQRLMARDGYAALRVTPARSASARRGRRS